MKSLLEKITNLVLYGNFWIAGCALFMSVQTQFLLIGRFIPVPVFVFIFSSTLFLYAIHRIVGLEKVKAFNEKGRYQVIANFKYHILFYAVTAGVLALLLFFYLSWQSQLGLLLIGGISFAYVLPFMAGRKRLRDLNYIKVFAIALTWPLVTILLPAFEMGVEQSLLTWILLAEKFFFILAITLPFDIRDLQVDLHTKVKTIPNQIGAVKTTLLAIVFLGISFSIFSAGLFFSLVSFWVWLSYFLATCITGFLIYHAPKVNNDYYFTGLLDGTMILQSILIIVASHF